MDERRPGVLSERLARLEREDRRLWRTGAIAPLGVAALVLMGQAPPGNVAKLVEAERFVLQESSERVRAVLHTQADGSPPLDFRDGAGNPRARLGLSGDVAAFSLTDAKGKGGSTLQTHVNGRPSFTLTDANGTRRTALFLSAGGSPTPALSDRRRASRVVRNALENGPMGLSLYDPDGRVRTPLDLEPDGSPA